MAERAHALGAGNPLHESLEGCPPGKTIGRVVRKAGILTLIKPRRQKKNPRAWSAVLNPAIKLLKSSAGAARSRIASRL